LSLDGAMDARWFSGDGGAPARRSCEAQGESPLGRTAIHQGPPRITAPTHSLFSPARLSVLPHSLSVSTAMATDEMDARRKGRSALYFGQKEVEREHLGSPGGDLPGNHAGSGGIGGSVRPQQGRWSWCPRDCRSLTRSLSSAPSLRGEDGHPVHAAHTQRLQRARTTLARGGSEAEAMGHLAEVQGNRLAARVCRSGRARGGSG
jgi:hypothetical protein